jgi:hypothetical protein
MSDWDQSQQPYDNPSAYEDPAVGGWGDTYGEQAGEQAYDDPSAYGDPAVGGWGDSYGDAPAQEQGQGFWEDVKDWVDDLIDDPSQQESSGSGEGILDVIEDAWRPAQDHIDRRNELIANHLAAFRGSLNSAIQATELLGAESSSDQVRYASGMVTNVAQSALVAADEIGRETQTGGKYAYYQGALAAAASELQAIAASDSEAVRSTDIPDVLDKLHMIGRDSESLY